MVSSSSAAASSNAPWIPRMHLFEIDDQPWFPPWLRARVQDGLTHAWTTSLPPLQACSPAALVAQTLQRVLGRSVGRYTYVDFCSGAGGPTPSIERALNDALRSSWTGGDSSNDHADAPSYAAVTRPDRDDKKKSSKKHKKHHSSKSSSTSTTTGNTPRAADGAPAVDFVMTDLHPHPEAWAAAVKKSPHLHYEPTPVDAANAPADLLRRYGAGGDSRGGGRGRGRGVFRLFNLAFHHFDDPLARAILRNTVATSEGFGIFELQDRSLASMVTCFLFGAFVMLGAPLFYWWAPLRLFWVYVVPVIPFVLVFDGLVSSLRTRTPAEVEALLRTCGADTSDWVLESGRERFLWPTGHLHWIICTKKQSGLN